MIQVQLYSIYQVITVTNPFSFCPYENLSYYFAYPQMNNLTVLPGSLIGFDKEGYVVYLDVMGRLEATDLVRCVSNSECYIMKIIESYGIMEVIRCLFFKKNRTEFREKEKKAGKQLGSAIIFDLEGLGFSQLTVFNQFTPIIQFLQVRESDSGSDSFF